MSKPMVWRFLGGLFSIGLIVVVAFRLLSGFNTSYKTVRAELVTETKLLSTKGIAVKEEVILSNLESGYLLYLYTDGSRVSKDMAICEVYASQEDVARIKEVEALEAEIAMLQNASDPGVANEGATDAISKQLADLMVLTQSQYQQENFLQAVNSKNKFVELLSINNIITGTEDNFNQRISSLQNQLDSLRAGLPSSISQVRTTEGGYYVSHLDGYENIVSLDKLKLFNASDLEELLAVQRKPANNTAVGKVIKGYEWYFAVLVDNDRLPDFYNDSGKLITPVKLRIPDGTVITTSVNVEEVITRYGEDKGIVIFSCKEMNEALANLRIKNVEIELDTVTGLKVPRSAIRFDKENGDKMGVYVSIGSQVQFRYIESLYETSEYFICEVRDSATDFRRYLQQQDRIIIETAGVQ